LALPDLELVSMSSVAVETMQKLPRLIQMRLRNRVGRRHRDASPSGRVIWVGSEKGWAWRSG
jgi:hypothetical protein